MSFKLFLIGIDVKAWLDFARLLMAFVVLMDHSVILFLLPQDFWQAHRWFPWLNLAAAVAVCAFMMISGYAIAHSVTPQKGRFSLRRFYAHRIARIYPPLWAAIAVSVALIYGLPQGFIEAAPSETEQIGIHYYLALGTEDSPWLSILNTVFFAYDPLIPGKDAWPLIAPAWTLSFDVLMYLVAGTSFRLFRINHELAWAGGIAIWSALWLFALWSSSTFVSMFFGLWLLGFAIGLTRQWHRGIGTGVGLLLCSAIALYAYRLWVNDFLPLLPSLGTAPAPYEEGWVISLGLASMLFGSFFAFGALSEVLTQKLKLKKTFKIPDFSYSLYICHFPILLTLGALVALVPFLSKLPFWLLLGPIITTVLILCWLISLLTERKSLFAWPLLKLLAVAPAPSSLKDRPTPYEIEENRGS